jgi:hypothetical protein
MDFPLVVGLKNARRQRPDKDHGRQADWNDGGLL